MGSVHQQTVNEGRGCEEFYHVSLSEINTIKSLIINRTEFDPCFKATVDYNEHPFVSNGVPLFQEPVAVLYLDLESLIEECKLNKYEQFIIKLLMRGYDFEFIGENLKWDTEKVENIFNLSCRKLKDQNDYIYKTWLEQKEIVKIPEGTKFKKCTNCEKGLPFDDFGNDDRNKDGKKSICKKCDSYTKKTRKIKEF